MVFEDISFEQPAKPRIECDEQFVDFLPAEFKEDPFGYFEHYGQNAKTGEIQKDDSGKVTEDPTAVKLLPDWENKSGEKIAVVGKRVNIEKAKMKKFSDPFYEYKIMKIAKAAGLPAATPIAMADFASNYLVIMEKLPGISWHEAGLQRLKETGCSEEDIADIQRQAEGMMAELREKYEKEGIYRTWYLKDMVIDIDFADKKVQSVTPIDWEKTKIEE